MNSNFHKLLFLLAVFCSSIAFSQYPTESKHETANEPLFQSNELIKFLGKPLKDSLRLVRLNGKYGIIDSASQTVVPSTYDQINASFKLREVLLLERKYLPENELFYFFWEDGNESEELYEMLLEQEMETPNSAYNLEKAFRSEPFFAARKGIFWGVINARNEALIPFEYDLIEEIGQNIFSLKKNDLFEIRTSNNEIIVDSCDTIIMPWKDNQWIDLGSEFAVYAMFLKDNKYGAINVQNLETILPKYDRLEYCNFLPEDSWICAFNPNDISFNRTVEQYKRTHNYYNVILYKLNNKVGLLDTRCMEEITPASFENIRIVYGRTSGQIVQLDSMYTFLTHDNTLLHTKLYDSVSALTSSHFKVSLNGKTGVYNESGEKLLKLKWEDVQSILPYSGPSSPYYIVQRNGKLGMIDSREKKILPFRYDSIAIGHENYSRFFELERNQKKEKIYFEDL